ncbi:hypothetical protein VPH35_098370 [Triticum aestivum]
MNRLRAAAQREQHGLHLPGPCLPLPPSLLLHLLHGLPPGQQPRQGRPGSGPGRGHHGGPRQGRPLRRPGRHRHRQVRLQQAPSGSQRRRLRRGQVARLPVPRVQDRYPRRSFSSFCHLPLPSFKSFDSFRCRPPPKVQIPPPAPQHTVPVIAINKEFPGPVVNVTTNYNVAVNVLNSLDEPLLITWDGIQQRKNCWQDGVLGTNCPIPPGWNWTYNFQVMDDACKSLDYPEDQTCAFSSVSSDISAAMLFYLYSVWSDLWFLDGLGYPIYLSFIS